MTVSYRFIPVTIIVVAAGAAQAQEIIELDEITAFANLTPTEIARTGATVDVITEAEIRAEAPARLSDILARRPGVSVANSGPPGTTSLVRIRGLAAPYIGVRLDGIDVTDPSLVQAFFNFGTLDAADLSRVEILRGSQSAIAGSSAVGGVVNITTRRAKEEGRSGELQFEAGSFGTFRSALGLSNLGPQGEANLSLSRVTSDGFSAADENNGNIEPDGFDATRLSFYGDHAVSDRLVLGVNGFFEESASEFDNFEFTPPFLPVDGPFLSEETDATTRGLRLFAEIDGDAVTSTFALSYFDNDRFTDFGSGTSNFLGERIKADYLGTTTIQGDVTLSFGAEAAEERFESSDSFGGAAEGDRRVLAAFAEGLVPVTEAFDLSLALRLDSYSDFGEFVSGRLAGAYRLDGGTILRGVLSNGFRAPSLFEVNDPAFGNADLTEEESRNVELGIEQVLSSGASVQATLFYTEINNLIEFEFPAGYVQTDGQSRTQGIELAATSPLGPRAELFGNYTYTDASGPDGQRLSLVPRHDLTLGVEAQITERLGGIATVQYVSDVIDGVALDDYTVANAVVDYALSDSAEAYLRIDNIFDEQYQTVRGYGTSDRAVYVGFRARF